MATKKAVSLPMICLLMAAILCMTFAGFLCTASAEQASPAETTLILYEGPKTMTTSKYASIKANGSELFVYDVMVNHAHIWNANTIPSDTPMAYFDFEGAVTLEIEMPGLGKDIESAVVLPTSYGIVPVVSGNRVTFTVTEPGFYTVVYNGSVNKATHIFANPLETDIPDKDDPNVIFIEPGHWTIDAISLKSDQTLYISGGAVLDTMIVVDNAVNATIRGRGIIDGTSYPAHNQSGSFARVPLDVRNSKNFKAEGFIIANSNCWNFNIYNTDTANISNVKIISGRQNGDGFTYQSCKNIVTTDCFVRSWDDSLVIKNYSGSSKNITFERIQIWTDLAQSMEIGYETNKGLTIRPEISNVLFKDITVLYNHHKPVISIHNSDDATVHDITYQNIIVENAFMQGDNGNNNELIEMNMSKSGWSTVKDEWGSIKNILIDGLTVVNTLDGKVPASRILGFGKDNLIDNVTIRNVNILGNDITDLKAMKLTVNEYVTNITIESAAGEAPSALAAVIAPVLDANEIATNLTIIETPAQTEAERPAAFPVLINNWIQTPDTENLALNKNVVSGAVTDVYKFKNVVDGDATSYWESKGWPAEITIDLAAPYAIKTVVVRLNPSPIWEPRIQAIEVLASVDGESFTSIVPNTRYQFDSDLGNLIRIDFEATDAQYVKLIFTENTAGRTGGAQAAEIEVYE